MNSDREIRDRIGISYLGNPSVKVNSQSSVNLSPNAASGNSITLDRNVLLALLAVGGRLIEILKSQPNLTDSVYELVDKTDIDLESLMKVIEPHERAGIVIVDRDRRGNHVIHLAATGASVS